jgi:mono/diheme cytochrome c family protein
VRILWTLVVVLVVAIAAVIVFIYSGGFNVTANRPQGGFLDDILQKVQDRSVEVHASRIPDPDLALASVPIGAFHYDEICVTCHGGPGAKVSAIGRGLNPDPPDLAESAKELKPREIYWVVKNGIRMTGMPSFGVTYDENQIRGLAAFVLRLPGMSPGEFHVLADAGRTQEEGGHEEHGTAVEPAPNAPAEEGVPHDEQPAAEDSVR